MQQNKPAQRTCRVIKNHQASYPDPITMHANDPLEVSDREDAWNNNPDQVFIWCTNQQGKSGWVPGNYIDRTATVAKARVDYTAIELSVSAGEPLIAGKEESGWVWCTNAHQQSGWVPAENIEYI